MVNQAWPVADLLLARMSANYGITTKQRCYRMLRNSETDDALAAFHAAWTSMSNFPDLGSQKNPLMDCRYGKDSAFIYFSRRQRGLEAPTAGPFVY
jgi:hypothetical protein